MLALQGCTAFGFGKPIVVAADAPCVNLVPKKWYASAEDGGGVQHAPDPSPAPPAPAKPAPAATPQTWADYWRAMFEWALDEQKKWTSFGVAEAQKVEDANGRTQDAVKIAGDCERRDAAGVKAAARRTIF